MSDQPKTMCKFKKEGIEKNFDLIKMLVRNPKFICKKCGRVAEKQEWLCKPTTLQ